MTAEQDLRVIVLAVVAHALQRTITASCLSVLTSCVPYCRCCMFASARRGVTTGSAVYVAWPTATSQHYIACILSVTPAVTTAATAAATGATATSTTATATVVYEGGEVEVGVSPSRMKLAPGESLVTPYAGRPGQGRSARYMHAHLHTLYDVT
jgi:hypothetical protein